jgi:hypothetical protein
MLCCRTFIGVNVMVSVGICYAATNYDRHGWRTEGLWNGLLRKAQSLAP